MRSMKSRSKWRGFTLIELLVVIAILGVLAATAIPQFSKYRAGGFNALLQTDARNAATAEEAYYVSQQSYATTGDCGSLSGMVVSKGVTCTLGAGSGTPSFKVTATHPGASYAACMYDNGAFPHLACF